MAQEIRFYLKISAHEYLRYYQGSARNVLVHAYDGRRVKFPASALQPFVTREGIEGEFALKMDANHKLLGLERLKSR